MKQIFMIIYGKLKTHENEEKEKDSGISEDDDECESIKRWNFRKLFLMQLIVKIIDVIC